MNVLVIDTSSWISYFRQTPMGDVDLALKEGRVFLPPIVAAELLSAPSKSSERERLVEFLKELPLCEISFPHWVRVGELRAQLARKGVQISTPDAHIAQCCLDLEGYLLSEDRIFKKVAAVTPLKLLPTSPR